jgi:hypothetical protein
MGMESGTKIASMASEAFDRLQSNIRQEAFEAEQRGSLSDSAEFRDG